METSSPRHSAQTRDQVLVAHAANQIARTSLSQDDFAQSLSRELHLSIPERAKKKEVPDFNSPELAPFVSSPTSSVIRGSLPVTWPTPWAMQSQRTLSPVTARPQPLPRNRVVAS